MSNIAQSDVPIQQESVQTGNPTSESMFASMGGAINFCLANVMPLGSLIMSVLNETQFQGQTGTNWVLADGRTLPGGTAYQTLTGNAVIPDFRGTYPRASDSGGSARGARGLDPNGVQPTGTYIADQFASHTHQTNFGQVNYGVAVGDGGLFVGADFDNSGVRYGAVTTPTGRTTTATGGAETAPKTTYMNVFIRIN